MNTKHCDVAVIGGGAAGLRLSGVRMGDGAFVPRTAVAVGPRMVARSGVLAGLGLRAVPHAMGAGFGEHIESDETGRTAVPGVWVAGNVTDLQAQVITAAAQGLMAGAAVNADLVMEDARRAAEVATARGLPHPSSRCQGKGVRSGSTQPVLAVVPASVDER